MRNKLTHTQQRDFSLALAAFIIALVLWQMQGLFFITYPFRLFVTLIHELGHGLSAIVTGGAFIEFIVNKRGAGMAYTRGGLRFVVIQAGYLGTALFGAVLLYLTHRVQQPGRVAMGVGVFIGIVTFAYSGFNVIKLNPIELVTAGGVFIVAAYLFLTQETDEGRYVGLSVAALGGLLLILFAGAGNVLTILVGLFSALILIWIGLRAGRDVIVITLTFLAFLTGLQAITDAWVLLKIVSMTSALMPSNDAGAMAHEFGGSAQLWALVWIMADVLIFGTALYFTLFSRRSLNQNNSTKSGGKTKS